MEGEIDTLHLENMSLVSVQQPSHGVLTMNILTTPPLHRFVNLLAFDLLYECKVPLAQPGLHNIFLEGEAQ